MTIGGLRIFVAVTERNFSRYPDASNIWGGDFYKKLSEIYQAFAGDQGLEPEEVRSLPAETPLVGRVAELAQDLYTWYEDNIGVHVW